MKTLRQIADGYGKTYWQVQYVIRKNKIKPDDKAGPINLYSNKTMNRIIKHLLSIGGNND